MNKFKRNERIGAIVKILSTSPNHVYTLNYFTNLFNSAKSTISEDLAIVKKILEDLSLGRIETIAGAAGGVKFIPFMSYEDKTDILTQISDEANQPNRIIPGGYIYTADILYNPSYIKKIGDIFAELYSEEHIDLVMTVETKGIPIAMMTAQGLNVPLVIARNENRVTEGSTISINYVSGSTGKLQTMYITKKSIPKGSRVLIVDDFMRAGGTANGMIELVNELESTVVGTCVLMDTVTPEKKLVSDYHALIIVDEKEDGKIEVYPNEPLLKASVEKN